MLEREKGEGGGPEPEGVTTYGMIQDGWAWTEKEKKPSVVSLLYKTPPAPQPFDSIPRH